LASEGVKWKMERGTYLLGAMKAPNLNHQLAVNSNMHENVKEEGVRVRRVEGGNIPLDQL